MSVSDKEISNVGLSGGVGLASGVDGDDNDDDGDDESGVHRRVDHDHRHDHHDDQRRKEQRVKGHGFCGFSSSTSLGKRAKSFVLRPLKRKASKKKTHVTNKGSSSSSSSSTCYSNSFSGSGNVSNSGNKGCHFCFTRASVGESVSPNGSQTSDPNDPNFTYDMLRVLIERNDFCSKECNTHLDSDDCID